ncbi:MAG: hypothetical protein JXK05_08625 [Campylobacterales bacterium]|nr:hypothetical protein [Campylobacterales bacterium]
MRIDMEAIDNRRLAGNHLSEIPAAALGIRKQVRIYHTVETNGISTVMVVLSQKSRIVLKDIPTLESIANAASFYIQRPLIYKMLLSQAPICSKARSALESLGWGIA